MHCKNHASVDAPTDQSALPFRTCDRRLVRRRPRGSTRPVWGHGAWGSPSTPACTRPHGARRPHAAAPGRGQWPQAGPPGDTWLFAGRVLHRPWRRRPSGSAAPRAEPPQPQRVGSRCVRASPGPVVCPFPPRGPRPRPSRQNSAASARY